MKAVSLFHAVKKRLFAASFLLVACHVNAQVIDANHPANFEQLDVNIYWYGANNANQRAVAGQANPFFNPSKPTIIYIHGWQPNTVTSRKRENFNRLAVNESSDVARAWLDKGWNVGIFYWNQLADEAEVKDAEAKIYTVDRSKFTNAARWRHVNGSYYQGPALTVSQQFVNAYKSAMAGYSGPEVRIAGHSLGAQLAVTTTSLLWEEKMIGQLAPNLVPARVALLDPAYLSGPHSWIGNKWTGEVARELVRENRHEVIYEAYRTSGSTSNGFIGDTNTGLIDMITLIEIKPWMYGALDFTNKHNFAPGYYFMGMGFRPPVVKCNGRPVASAAQTASISRTLATETRKFEQIDGKYTRSPGDDTWDMKGDGC